MKIQYYETQGWKVNASALRLSINDLEAFNRRWVRDDKGKIDGIFLGIVESAIPQWYWTWFRDSGLEAEVIAQNRRNFVAAMRHGMNMANLFMTKIGS